MCEVQNKFILCSCAIAPKERPNPDNLIWTLHAYRGKHDYAMEGIIPFPSSQIAHGLTSEWVASELNERNCFDFEHVPQEREMLKIDQGQDRYEPKFLSFIYQEGKWVRDEFYGFQDWIQQMRAGKLIFAEKSRLNTMRTMLLAEIEPLDRKMALEASFLQALLSDIEALDRDAWEKEADIVGYVGLLWDISLQKAAQHFEVPKKFLPNLYKRLQKAAEYPEVLPTVPYRKALNYEEWNAAWAKAEHWLYHRKPSLWVTDEEIGALPNKIANCNDRLFCLYAFGAAHSYQVAAVWVQRMFEQEDYIWLDETGTWVVQADGNGYYRVWGDFG
jgi:hypothetical protein